MKLKEKYVHKRYLCPICDDGKTREGKDLRPHVRRHHPDITALELERHIALSRYPDLDALTQRYIDRLETLMTLLDKGVFLKKYLQTLGVLRDYRADLSIQGIHRRNPGLQSAEDVRAAYERELIGKFREASPEARFQGYLNRENSKLEKAGQADLIEPISTLKTIKFVKQRLQEVLEDSAKPDETEPETT